MLKFQSPPTLKSYVAGPGSTRRAWPLPGMVGFSALAATIGAAILGGCSGGDSPSAVSAPSSVSSNAALRQSVAATEAPPGAPASLSQVLRGRSLVASLGCSDCHNRGNDNPSDPHWLAGFLPGTPGQPFQVGPFQTFPRNLTPDAATGIGQNTDQQIYNALKFGLDPDDTPDIIVTSHTPGIGNFPAKPHYLAPPMPWPAFRHLPDADIRAIVAYLKHGIKPVTNRVPVSGFPPDFWASTYASSKVGLADFPPYPSGNEHFVP